MRYYATCGFGMEALVRDELRELGIQVERVEDARVFFYVLGPLFILRCSLQGMGRKVIPVCSSVVEMTIKVLSATILVPRLAYFGVALTEPISWVCMTILLTVAYFAKPPEQMLRKSA